MKNPVLGPTLLGLTTLAARLPIPHPAERFLGRFALLLLSGYRRRVFGSTGRRCLFSISCSTFAADEIRTRGLRAALPSIQARLKRCGGEYSLIRTATGAVILQTSDGFVFQDRDVADILKAPQGA